MYSLPSCQKAFHHSRGALDRKSTRLNSSHSQISYAVFCLKKKKNIRLQLGHHPMPREPSPTVERLTHSLEQLKNAFARETPATADISHELWTPVAALMTTGGMTTSAESAIAVTRCSNCAVGITTAALRRRPVRTFSSDSTGRIRGGTSMACTRAWGCSFFFYTSAAPAAPPSSPPPRSPE